MSLENGVNQTKGIDLKPQDPLRFIEECPTCGNQTYLRCGAIGKCSDELCPNNDDGDYGN